MFIVLGILNNTTHSRTIVCSAAQRILPRRQAKKRWFFYIQNSRLVFHTAYNKDTQAGHVFTTPYCMFRSHHGLRGNLGWGGVGHSTTEGGRSRREGEGMKHPSLDVGIFLFVVPVGPAGDDPGVGIVDGGT